MYSKWSAWSRCVNCYQRRMKKCLSLNCFDSRIYEERPCPKKRCRRKFRHQHKAHIIHLDAVKSLEKNRTNLKFSENNFRPAIFCQNKQTPISIPNGQDGRHVRRIVERIVSAIAKNRATAEHRTKCKRPIAIT